MSQSSLSTWFGWGGGNTRDSVIPDIFPLSISATEFVKNDIASIYSKILTDTLERTHGLTDDQQALMWDNCVQSSAPDGLVTLLSKAMTDKAELFLVYEKSVGVIRKATFEESNKIKADYEKQASSSLGVYVSFKNFTRSDMVKFYLGLEYCTVASLHKSMNISKAVQIKMSDMRASVSITDSAEVKSQALSIAESLGKGLDILLDAKDIVETAKPDLKPVNEAVAFLVKKMSFYLGLPEAYLTGEQTSGMGSTGENDMRAVERGLKFYFFSIIKPVTEALFGINAEYKTQDITQIEGSMEVLKTFSLIDESLISHENKTKIVNMILNLPEDSEGDGPPEPAPVVVVPPKNKPPEDNL